MFGWLTAGVVPGSRPPGVQEAGEGGLVGVDTAGRAHQGQL